MKGHRPITRREALLRCTNGFGAVALSGLLSTRAFAEGLPAELPPSDRLRPDGGLHHAPRARNVIFLYMDGGPSQVDTFDPKPRLDRENGQPIGMKIPKTQFDDVGDVLKSPWKFTNHGESGTPVSSLFPHVGAQVDKLCVVRSMVSEFPEHTNANYFLHTGSGLQGRPSVGAWLGYGLGASSQDLPGFCVLNGGLIPPGGADCFGSGFLSRSYQASVFREADEPMPNVVPSEVECRLQENKLDLVRALDGLRSEKDDAVEAAIKNYELAYRMQSSVPELADISGESPATRALYGLDAEFEPTRRYASMCLLARRLVERGVRFVEVTCPETVGDRWDQHGDLKKGHEENALAVDQPIAGLLRDLEARGLLNETLVVWAGEFGRTPMAQGTNGRDHNPHGFSIWLAGGGVRGGHVHGATDDYGYFAVDGRVTIHDLHATMLHLLGIDHTKLTFRFSGRDIRLTDVHGEIVESILI